jgi:nucleoside-diphosphate-sugar epimerase
MSIDSGRYLALAAQKGRSPLKIAVTGASGFIGRHLIPLLAAEGHQLRILSRRGSGPEGVEVHRGVLGSDPPERFVPFVRGAEILIHCAGEIGDAARMEAVHVRGAADLLAAADGALGRWVQLSSVGAYGPVRSGIVDEDMPQRPVGPYEETKAQADALVLAAARGGAFSAAVLRPSIVIGPDMPNSSVRQMAGAIRRRLFFFIGRPGASANYVHVDDVARALAFLATAPHEVSGLFNLSAWSTIEDFAAALARAGGTPAPTRRLPERPVRLAARLAGWIPGFPLNSSRIDALTGRASYPSARLERHGFALLYGADEAAAAVAAQWRQA